MKLVNVIIKRINRNDYKIIFVYGDGTWKELPSIMSFQTANAVRKAFKNI